MPLKKWVMKQYWRVSTIRTLLSLGMWMLILGRSYYGSVPIVSDMGFLGALILGAILFSFFLGLGWAYDTQAKMWSPKMQASIERNPYRYVPAYSSLSMEKPFVYALLYAFLRVFRKAGLDGKYIVDAIGYFDEYFARAPIKDDIMTSEGLARNFMDKHPFLSDDPYTQTELSILEKSKLEFEVWMFRISRIQSLTGMFQDILLIAASYVVIIFPADVADGVVPFTLLLMAIFVLSVPIFFAITVVGWYYDRKLSIWAVDTVVRVERNPYSYVADPRLLAIILPAIYALLHTLRDIYIELDMDTSDLEKLAVFLDKYTKLKPSRKEDFDQAKSLRKDLGNIFVNNAGEA